MAKHKLRRYTFWLPDGTTILTYAWSGAGAARNFRKKYGPRAVYAARSMAGGKR